MGISLCKNWRRWRTILLNFHRPNDKECTEKKSPQPPLKTSYHICEINLEDIQPADGDTLAYEQIQTGRLTLPKEIPDAPIDHSEDLGFMFFSISYDAFNKTLTVLIERAEGLPKMDLNGTSDPYVKISLIPNAKAAMKTRVKRRNLAPIWKEKFTFMDFPHEKLTKKSLYLQVYDYDRFSRDDAIGNVTLPLQHISLQSEPVEFVKELIPTHSSEWLGEILLSLCYKPSENHLTVIVMKGKNLKRMDLIGLSDPYLNVTLMSCGRTIAKKRTSVKKKCLDPVWNEAMVFNIVIRRTRDIQVVVTVMEYNHYFPDKTVGQVIIGSRSTSNAIKHWTDVLSSPRTAIAMWHTIEKQEKL